ncbi:hypothetical protein BGO17_04410 [Candidatus Saccharibacteria bacterium 49-20]|nr:MAG: hypothetical protein BGO17_04410 [Candidatus Saccharibacteria bacterium 49-20]
MNGVLNTGLEFWQIIVGLTAIVLSVIAIKFTFSIDVNKLLERRDKNNSQKLQNACPHFQLVGLEGKEFEVRSLFYKPAGTFMHKCRQCGVITALDEEQHERDANHYVKNPQALIDEQAKLTKLAKKTGRVAK